jgi:hypothetical protein
MIREHELKTLPIYFDAIESGDKTFEVRRDDRGFQKGDILTLKEWIPYDEEAFLSSDRAAHYSGREIRRKIQWILTGGQFGIEPGFVVMALSGEDA